MQRNGGRADPVTLNCLFFVLPTVKDVAVQKKRTRIRDKTRVAVLKEYHHKCAFGHVNPPAPELHHIDGDPSNHDPLNILPLCPNCHSQNLNPRMLSVFRKYKKREIFSAEFENLLRKADAILNLPADQYYGFCVRPGEDLVAFVRQLKQGKYYAPRIGELIRAMPEQETLALEEHEAFHKDRCEDILSLIIELLSFQGWKAVVQPGASSV